jgi:hypothetical protein
MFFSIRIFRIFHFYKNLFCFVPLKSPHLSSNTLLQFSFSITIGYSYQHQLKLLLSFNHIRLFHLALRDNRREIINFCQSGDWCQNRFFCDDCICNGIPQLLQTSFLQEPSIYYIKRKDMDKTDVVHVFVCFLFFIDFSIPFHSILTHCESSMEMYSH